MAGGRGAANTTTTHSTLILHARPLRVAMWFDQTWCHPWREKNWADDVNAPCGSSAQRSSIYELATEKRVPLLAAGNANAQTHAISCWVERGRTDDWTHPIQARRSTTTTGPMRGGRWSRNRSGTGVKPRQMPSAHGPRPRRRQVVGDVLPALEKEDAQTAQTGVQPPPTNEQLTEAKNWCGSSVNVHQYQNTANRTRKARTEKNGERQNGTTAHGGSWRTRSAALKAAGGGKAAEEKDSV